MQLKLYNLFENFYVVKIYWDFFFFLVCSSVNFNKFIEFCNHIQDMAKLNFNMDKGKF